MARSSRTPARITLRRGNEQRSPKQASNRAETQPETGTMKTPHDRKKSSSDERLVTAEEEGRSNRQAI